MTERHLSQYRNAQLLGMSQTELVVVLYQGAIRFLQEAIDLVSAERYDLSWKKFDRARRIVVHLCGTLNREAGELTEKLTALYTFVIDQITVANARRDIAAARTCIEILTTLKEGWEGVAAEAGNQLADTKKEAGKLSAARQPTSTEQSVSLQA